MKPFGAQQIAYHISGVGKMVANKARHQRGAD